MPPAKRTRLSRPPARGRARARRPALRERARQFLPGRSLRIQIAGGALALGVALAGQSFASAHEGGAIHLVQPGETLGSIAAATGLSLERLVALNKLPNPDLIVAGQALELAGDSPGPSDQVAAAAPGEYAVKPGDTLWDIAQATGVPPERLAQLNGLASTDRLTVGQRLRLGAGPGAAAPRPPTPAALTQRVLAEARRVGGDRVRVGLAAKNLLTGDRVDVRPNDLFPSASVMKLPLLVELERQAFTGELPWSESLRAQAGAMIAVSDNAAANKITDQVGEAKVNATMARLGLPNTRLLSHFSDAPGGRALPSQNQTTPAEMAQLLQLIATDQIVNARVSGDIRSLLARNTDRSKLARLLPADAQVAHKSGWYDGVANDVGIVSVDRGGARWVIAVLADGVPDAETGNQLVAVVSRAVYDAWAGGGR